MSGCFLKNKNKIKILEYLSIHFAAAMASTGNQPEWVVRMGLWWGIFGGVGFLGVVVEVLFGWVWVGDRGGGGRGVLILV